jgi:hypothetical protein
MKDGEMIRLVIVMPGLVPGIHATFQYAGRSLDCRVKPGNDD